MFDIIKKQTKGLTYHTYRYKNDHMDITFSQFGATIIDWQTKDHEGTWASIILKYADADDFFIDDKSLGATVGPYAGRIYPPEIHLSHGTYRLEKNFMSHSNLHSGSDNLQKHLYEADVIDDHTIRFWTRNDTGGSSYPGNTIFTLTFQIQGDTLIQTYESVSDQDTYTNLTNHTYFNLSGDAQRDILDHELVIPSDMYGDLDAHFITKAVEKVDGTIFDFRKPKALKEAIIPLKETPIKGLDHPFVLGSQDPIVLSDPVSKRTLYIETNQDAVVVYSNNFLTDLKLYPNQKDRPHLAICLETQHYPNDIHTFKDPKSFHPKSEIHRQVTKYTIKSS